MRSYSNLAPYQSLSISIFLLIARAAKKVGSVACFEKILSIVSDPRPRSGDASLLGSGR